MDIVKNEMRISAHEILQYIDDFCTSQDLDVKSLSHSQFKAACIAIGHHFFSDGSAMLYKNNNRHAGFDYDLIIDAYNIYNSICLLYDKIPSLISFCYFVNVDYFLFSSMINKPDRDGSSLQAAMLLQKLINNREDALKDRAIDKGGAVGVAIVGNAEFAWNDPKNRIQVATAPGAECLPVFSKAPEIGTL